jgi:hypothetical protein
MLCSAKCRLNGTLDPQSHPAVVSLHTLLFDAFRPRYVSSTIAALDDAHCMVCHGTAVLPPMLF